MSGRAAGLGVLIVGAVGIGLVAAVVTSLRTADDVAVVEACSATADGQAFELDVDQADNAALIAAVAVRRAMPARAVTIALATALQESKLLNIDYGDRDSLGLFQQRPSQGWGTEDEVMDPIYAAGAFYDALEKVDNYRELDITEAAQAVQRSAYPEAYAQHEPRARAWASALTGYSTAALTCVLGEPTGRSDADVVQRVGQDLGLATRIATDSDGTRTATIEVAPDVTEVDRVGWAIAQWSVATADALGTTTVAVGGHTWSRATATWTQVETEPLTAGVVVLTLAAP